jgi:hypothetical protein
MMPILQGQPEGLDSMAERREFTRFTASSLSYIDLGESNGGLMLNLSEGGVSVHAAEVLIGDIFPRIRFHLPKSEDWVDTGGRIVWRGKTKKEAGIRFIDMPPYTRRKIREWLAFEAQQDESRMTWQTVPPASEATWNSDAPIERPPFEPPSFERPAFEPPPVPPPVVSVTAEPPPKIMSPAARFPMAAASVPVPVAAKRAVVRHWRAAPPTAVSAPRFRMFDTREDGYEHERATEPRRWMLMTAVTCVVGVLCFIAGMSMRTPSVPTPAAQALNSGENRPATTTPAGPVAGKVTPASDGARPSAGGATPAMAAVGSSPPGAGAASNSSSNPLAGNSGGHGIAPPAPPTPVGNSGGAPVLLNLGEIAVGASPFVAITTRLSLMAPAGFPTGAGEENNYLHAGDLIYMVEPAYPPDAIRDRVEGTVEVVARFARDGTIESVNAYSGADILSAAAVVSVRQWRYAPTYLYGRTVETIQHVKFVFRLP